MALRNAIAQKHRCYYEIKEEKKVGDGYKEVFVEHIKPSCLNSCCLGGDFNEFFKHRPTELELHQFIERLEVKGELAKEHARKRKQNLYCEHSSDSQLITISIDQTYLQPIKAQYDILDRIRKSDYKWMTDDAIASFEYYGKDENWNPHVHLIITKTKKPSDIAQALNRVFYEKRNKKTGKDERVEQWKYCIYARVNCVDLTKEAANNYIHGDKADDKMAAVDKDREYREKNGVPHTIKIKDC